MLTKLLSALKKMKDSFAQEQRALEHRVFHRKLDYSKKRRDYILSEKVIRTVFSLNLERIFDLAVGYFWKSFVLS